MYYRKQLQNSSTAPVPGYVLLVWYRTWTWPGTRIPRRWTCRCSPARGRAGHAHVYLSTKTTASAWDNSSSVKAKYGIGAELAMDSEHEKRAWKRGNKSQHPLTKWTLAYCRRSKKALNYGKCAKFTFNNCSVRVSSKIIVFSWKSL